jgi:hypothetical protein
MAPLIINCEKYAEISSKDMDRPLSFWERVALKIHRVACPPCNEVRDQMKLIRDACRWAPDEDNSDDNQCAMPESVRQQIKSALKNL